LSMSESSAQPLESKGFLSKVRVGWDKSLGFHSESC
jgi:hypothetical protein